MAISALAGWFGGNRMLAHNVGEALEGCSWVGVPFAGGMSELPHITARTILVNDLHRHIINLTRVVASDVLRPDLIRRLRRRAFHPDELKLAQELCDDNEPNGYADLDLAEQYFVCCWMGRGGKAGIEGEFNGRPSVRWKADGGDSMVRYQSAIRMLATFSKTLRRCTFETMDVFDFLGRCEDLDGHGIYLDPPFPGAGLRYRHHPPADGERAWHDRLESLLGCFAKARIVCRYYDHPWIRDIYDEDDWDWHLLTGRKQSNEDAAEVLLVRNGQQGRLF